MTYNVFGGTLSLTQSINHCRHFAELTHIIFVQNLRETVRLFSVVGSFWIQINV